jgi:hypothetical protein
MAKDRDPKPFTSWLGYGLAAIVVTFPHANWAFIAICTRESRAAGVNACNISSSVDSIATAIPEIKRVVALLEQRGAHLQAEVFASTLSVALASAIATAVAMGLVTWLTVALLSRKSQLAYKRFDERARRTGMPVDSAESAALTLVLAIYALEEATWGYFGSTFSPSIMALNDDRALYMYSVLLGFFLLGLFLPAFVAARTIVLRRAAA